MEKPQSFIFLRKNRRRFHFFIDSHGLRWISKKLSHFHQPNERETERKRKREREREASKHQLWCPCRPGFNIDSCLILSAIALCQTSRVNFPLSLLFSSPAKKKKQAAEIETFLTLTKAKKFQFFTRVHLKVVHLVLTVVA